MGKAFLPLAKSPISTPDLWVKSARNWLATGIIKTYLNELQVYADSTGMQVKVKSGAANVQGIYFDSDAEEILAISAANASNPRIDRIIVRLDLLADSIDLAVLQGVPAVSPVAPALTQNNTRWEISLSQVYVGANVSTIAAGNITDERYFVKNANVTQENWTDAVLLNGWVNFATDWVSAQYKIDNFGNVHVRATIKNGTLTVAAFTLPVGYRPAKKFGFSGVDSTEAHVGMRIYENGEVIPMNGNTNRISFYVIFPAGQ
jgi:hypothetical protein